MVEVEYLGYLAAILTIICLMPQVYKTVRTRDTSGLSWQMYALFMFVSILWYIYGYIKLSVPLMISNIFVIPMSFLILMYVIIPFE